MDDGSRQNGWWTAHSGLSEGLTLSQTCQGLADDQNTWLQYYFQMINTLHLSLTTASWRPPGFSSARILQHAIVHSMTHTISGNQVRKEHPLSRKINFRLMQQISFCQWIILFGQQLYLFVDPGPETDLKTHFRQILVLCDRPVDISESDNASIPSLVYLSR